MTRRIPRTTIRLLELRDAPDMLTLRISNDDFLRPFEPSKPPGFLTLEAQRREIEVGIRSRMSDRSYSFGIFDARDRLVGRIALSNIVRGSWQNATLGYFVGREHNGRGHCTDAVALVLAFAFEDSGLHRVQAGVMPRNGASAKVLVRNGFRFEGLAPDYLRINDRWEDHHIYAITSERWGSLTS